MTQQARRNSEDHDGVGTFMINGPAVPAPNPPDLRCVAIPNQHVKPLAFDFASALAPGGCGTSASIAMRASHRITPEHVSAVRARAQSFLREPLHRIGPGSCATVATSTCRPSGPGDVIDLRISELKDSHGNTIMTFHFEGVVAAGSVGERLGQA